MDPNSRSAKFKAKKPRISASDLNIYFATSLCLYFRLGSIQIHTVYPRGLKFGMVDLLGCAEVLVNKRLTSVTSEVKRGQTVMRLSKSVKRSHFS